MNRIFGPLVAAGMVLASGAGQAEERTGRQILDEVANRQEASYESEDQTMTLIDKKGREEIREVRRYTRKGEDGQFKYLVVFRSPPGVKGVALLTWQHQNGEDDQWLYLPAQGEQMKRIAKGSRKNYFMGTDFAYEDLVSESRDKFGYTRLLDDTLDGKNCYVVEITPSDSELLKTTGYLKRLVWVRTDLFLIVRTDYYDQQGKLLKRQTASDPVNVSGSTWRPDTSRMDNFSNGHATVIHVERRTLEETAVPEMVFQQRFVLSGQHLRE